MLLLFRPDFWRPAIFPITTLLLAAVAGAARAQDLPSGAGAADIFGVAHADGKYYLTQEDFLDEGADQVLATGSRVIKLYLTPGRYPWNSDWPKNIGSLVAMAQTPYFQSVFSKPFQTFILTAYAFGRDDHYWTEGITPEQAADETRQFYDLSKHLLAYYKGTGKTFVLQNWEGDWALRRGSPKAYDPDYLPSARAIQGMIQWLNARQAGIVKARTEVRMTDVHVYGATEANRLEDSLAGKPGVANSVLPYTTVDLVSYSCYHFLDTPEHLAAAVDYLAARLPATALFGRTTRSVYLGEFGYPEHGQEGIEGLNRRLDNAIAVVKEKGLPWAIFWQMYGNEPLPNAPEPPLNGRTNDAHLRGFWMVKPDGSPAMAWHRYRRMFVLADTARATAQAIEANLPEIFHEDFSGPGGKGLGKGWTRAAHYGVVNEQFGNHRLRFEVPEGRDIPWGSATLDLADPQILGHGLNIGAYFEVTLRRLSEQGGLGMELFDSDQLRVGSDLQSGPSTLKAWNGNTWVAIAFDDHGKPVAFDWNKARKLGVRFDSADGHHATFSYYLDGSYAGSWLVSTSNKTLDKIGFYVQSKTSGAQFEFDDLRIYGH